MPFYFGKMLKINEEMLQLTKDMVAVSSVNTTKGEKDIGVFIEDYLRSIPYFKEHPNQVIVQTLKNDQLERRNVFALLLGEKDKNSKTIIFHGHTDTVGVEDYGALAGYAFDCDGLAEQLKEIELPEEVKKDLESGEYLFGRGACDMKSGDAVFMVLLKELSEHVSDLSGNILLSLNPVEENLHTGIIEGIEVIEKLKKEYDLDYVLAINNDYTCPMYPGDKHHYIYTGVGGKLLPCFYIQGRETHVGQCFEGYDPTTVMAELIKELNLNPEYSDSYEGEYALPPTLLKSKDLKGWYNVQTAKEALVYFNYFVLNADVRDITKKLVSAGDKAVRRASADLNIKYKGYCEKSGKDFQQIKNSWSVMSYEDLYQLVKNQDESIDKILAEETVKLQEAGVDKREIPVSYIRILLAMANIYHPVVVLYYATPYCPHNTLEKNDEALEKLEKILKVVEEENNIEYRMDGFFPSLSDSSYLSLDDSMESIATLKQNFPQMQQLYPLPLELIKKLNIKAVNFGVYGKDAHKSTERLQVPYSFGVLPELIMKTTEVFLNVC
ncbi:Arginine utilization protein RocB [Pseudobutyrivibrio xylanivorans DSM 14809]|uniref:Arginine utilization protein RocB n=2 Tax=Pseudobutyrivibrio xylanivorans TaxID=185007 RepID=A0A1M6JK65_PSEXY|nr:Arginine utilization protein RocB [Pseudobutyrivibrio xylanivorans DSM 14809]